MTIQYKGRWQWDWRDRQADVALNAGVPWDVEVIGGSNKLQGKLASVDLRSFEHDRWRRSAAADARPADGRRPDPAVGGANNARFERPAGVHVRLKLSGGTRGVEFDRQKLGVTSGVGLLESAGAAEAADRFEIEVTGGANRIVVVEA